jgi:hypothetical protein
LVEEGQEELGGVEKEITMGRRNGGRLRREARQGVGEKVGEVGCVRGC